MAFSVESRVPFVDRVLAEHVAALPLNQKLRGGWTKFVLRNGLRGLLPEAVRRRKSKMGFETPEDAWLRGEMADEVERTYATARFLPDWADVRRLREAFAAFRRRPGWQPSGTFFRYFILERWARQFLHAGAVPACRAAAGGTGDTVPRELAPAG
jgi:asparagine synthase (glutamine-hydrolysing)